MEKFDKRIDDEHWIHLNAELILNIYINSGYRSRCECYYLDKIFYYNKNKITKYRLEKEEIGGGKRITSPWIEII